MYILIDKKEIEEVKNISKEKGSFNPNYWINSLSCFVEIEMYYNNQKNALLSSLYREAFSKEIQCT